VDELLAAICRDMADRDHLLVSDATLAELARVVETRRLPDHFELEAISGFGRQDGMVQDAWSVRLRVPGGTVLNGTTGILIRDEQFGLRHKSEAERAAEMNSNRPRFAR
jgi:hypothetical protein